MTQHERYLVPYAVPKAHRHQQKAVFVRFVPVPVSVPVPSLFTLPNPVIVVLGGGWLALPALRW